MTEALPEYFVRRLPFPNRSVKAVTFPNDDGTFDIYVNTLYPEDAQAAALRHELEHLRLGHFYSDKPIREKENEADGRPATAPAEPRRAVPLFPSAEAFSRWLLGNGG